MMKSATAAVSGSRRKGERDVLCESAKVLRTSRFSVLRFCVVVILLLMAPTSSRLVLQGRSTEIQRTDKSLVFKISELAGDLSNLSGPPFHAARLYTWQ